MKEEKEDKKIKVLLDEVENSIKSIYQSIEKIAYVDSRTAQNFKYRLLKLSMKKDEMRPEEMLIEIMSIQREIIEYLDKQATIHPQDEKQMLKEKNNEKQEGVLKNNFFGTNLLGPILILNPYFTKYLFSLLGYKKKLYLEKEMIEAYEERVKEYQNAEIKY